MSKAVIKAITLSVIIGFCFETQAQLSIKKSNRIKPSIDTASFFNWPTVEDWPYPTISNNGKYAMYSIDNVPEGSSTMMLHAMDSDWKMELPGVRYAAFTEECGWLVYKRSSDTLCLLTLLDKTIEVVPNVQSFKLASLAGVEWLIFIKGDKELVLRNLKSKKQISYPNVDSYILSKSGSALVLKSVVSSSSNMLLTLAWANPFENQVQEIWKGSKLGDISLSEKGDQVAFLVEDNLSGENAIWNFKFGNKQAVKLIDDGFLRLEKNLKVVGIDRFTKDGERLFVNLTENIIRTKKSGLVPLNVWSYRDAKIQSQQIHEAKIHVDNYLAVLYINKPANILPLQQKGENIESRSDDIMVITYRAGGVAESYWNDSAVGTTSIVDVHTGNKVLLSISRSKISPNGKYVIGFSNAGDLCAYEISSGKIRNLTSSLAFAYQNSEKSFAYGSFIKGLGVAGWLPNDESVFVNDAFDIWLMDPTGKKTAMKLTDGFKRRIAFSFLVDDLVRGNIINPHQDVILKGFNKLTKQVAFYKLNFNEKNKIKLLSAGNYSYGRQGWPLQLVKARNANLYLVKREQVDQSPNIFSTTDFKTFKQISSVNPEKNFNWMTSELVNFKTSDRIPIQAILYKPENFDPKKKYPLIIHYYDKKSDELHKYRHPIVDNGGELDIAWFVSHGYLVCLTDIHFIIGETGESARKAVEGVARYLSKRPYVDSEHIGIQGHSFGGYETNYLLTHSDLFAAAVSSCGVSNIISDYGGLWPGRNSRQEHWEARDGMLGTNPWESRKTYVENSPIFYVNKVKAPVLMMANQNDMNVHFEEGLQFFLALRRGGKRAWMLEYDNGGHGVLGEDYKDYLLRMTQFFDHYLKGAPAPKWMLYGIPAEDKGYEDGMELVCERDKNGNWITPGPGLGKEAL